jgi:hypothetical protein
MFIRLIDCLLFLRLSCALVASSPRSSVLDFSPLHNAINTGITTRTNNAAAAAAPFSAFSAADEFAALQTRVD